MESIAENMKKGFSKTLMKAHIFVKRHLRIGLDDPIDSKFNTFLHLAVRDGNEREVRQLLRRGAQVSARNYEDETPLHVAVLHGHPNLIDLLIEHGANKEIRRLDGKTPMHMVAKSPNKVECLERLLKHGAYINARDVTGSNLLHLVMKARNKSTKLIEKLLQHGSNVNNIDFLNMNLLHSLTLSYGLTNREIKIIVDALIAKGIHLNVRNYFSDTPLHNAIERNMPHLVRFLLQNGARMDILNGQNLNSIEIAIITRSIDCLKVLIKHVVLKRYSRKPLNAKIIEQIKKYEFTLSLYRFYEKELKLLKFRKVDLFSETSYFEVLCGDIQDVMKIVRNENTLYVLRDVTLAATQYFWEFVDIWNNAVGRIERSKFVNFIEYPRYEPDIRC